MKFKISDMDIIFLSYDEPNADANYADLQSKIPWAKRVHGVKGSDAAHKACAEIADTDRFVIIDADNIVDKLFLYHEFEYDDHTQKDFDERVVFSWNAVNIINGLIYGNGSIKSWHKNTIANMKTHEAAETVEAQVDFCWDVQYIPIEQIFSTIHNNGSDFQAWRAGFREGVKLALHEGHKLTKEQLLNETIDNLQRLCIWMTVGADVDHGLWSVYGARQGLVKLMLTDWDYTQVRDFDYLANLWENIENTTPFVIRDEIARLGDRLKKELDMPIPQKALEPGQCEFIRTVFRNPPRI